MLFVFCTFRTKKLAQKETNLPTKQKNKTNLPGNLFRTSPTRHAELTVYNSGSNQLQQISFTFV